MSTEPETVSPFLIHALPGFTPLIGHLVSMMSWARRTTLHAVEGLDTEQLEHRLDGRANSIGMLLEHIACVEEGYQVDTFGWSFGQEHEARRQIGERLGPAARELTAGRTLAHHLERLAHVRTRTLEELSQRNDAWLYEERRWWDGRVANHYFMWFHVLEDEVNHRGQMRWIRKRLPGLAR